MQTIDVLSNPSAAINDDIYATPTLLRLVPGSERRIFGHFASLPALLETLECAAAVDD